MKSLANKAVEGGFGKAFGEEQHCSEFWLEFL
jgi:hypothetical protein